MPNRIIRESVWTSESLSRISLLAQGFWLRLLPFPDDFGRFDARLPVLKGRLFPLNDNVRAQEIEKWLQELAAEDMIRFYEVGGVRYGFIPSWHVHNKQRALLAKLPSPPPDLLAGTVAPDGSILRPPRVVREHEKADASTCEQTPADASTCSYDPTPRRDDSDSERSMGAARAATSRPGKRPQFEAPTLDEVRAEIQRRNSPIDPEAFHAHYTASGWRLNGGRRVVDWKACIVTWEKNRARFDAPARTVRPTPPLVGSNHPTLSPEEQAALDEAKRAFDAERTRGAA